MEQQIGNTEGRRRTKTTNTLKMVLTVSSGFALSEVARLDAVANGIWEEKSKQENKVRTGNSKHCNELYCWRRKSGS